MNFLTSIQELNNALIKLICALIEGIPIWIVIAIFVIANKRSKKKTNKTESHEPIIDNEEIPKDNSTENTALNNEIRNSNYTPTDPRINSDYQDTMQDWTNCYEPQLLLTRNELQQYKVLERWAAQHKYKILAKVRLADLVKPRGDQYNRNTLFWKIQAKHIDFAIVNENMRVLCIIELLDNSHHTAERKERDEFVKQVLTSCGYEVLFTYAPTEEQLNKACNIYPQYEQEQIPLQ